PPRLLARRLPDLHRTRSDSQALRVSTIPASPPEPRRRLPPPLRRLGPLDATDQRARRARLRRLQAPRLAPSKAGGALVPRRCEAPEVESTPSTPRRVSNSCGVRLIARAQPSRYACPSARSATLAEDRATPRSSGPRAGCRRRRDRLGPAILTTSV